MADFIEKFSSFLKYEKRFSEHTLKSYLNDIRQFSDFCIGQDIVFPAKVDSVHLRSWIAELSLQGLKARTVNRKISSLRTFFHFCRSRNFIERDPSLNLRGLKSVAKIPSALKEVEIADLFSKLRSDAGLEDNFPLLRDLTVLEIFYGTGIRRSELIELKVGDINLERGVVRVMGKGKKVREIPLTPDLSNIIINYMEWRGKLNSESEFLILTNKGKKPYPKFIYSLVKKYLSLVSSLEVRGPHSLRHSFATHLTENGADIAAVKKLLGHSSLASTQVYIHNSMGKLKEIYKQSLPR